MTTPEPSYPPLSTREIRTLPEGAHVIVVWSEGNDGPHEYSVHWRRVSRMRRPMRSVARGA